VYVLFMFCNKHLEFYSDTRLRSSTPTDLLALYNEMGMERSR
jgi:hypothetical protein